jgi:hypothetical protein
MAASTNVVYFVLNLCRFFSNNTTFNDFLAPTKENKAFKNQYFLDKKYRPLAVLREEASDILLPVYQI